MIDCRDVMARMWDYIDGELPHDELAQVREHLAVCKRCNPQYRFEITFLEAVAALKESFPSPSAGLRARVRAIVSPAS